MGQAASTREERHAEESEEGDVGRQMLVHRREDEEVPPHFRCDFRISLPTRKRAREWSQSRTYRREGGSKPEPEWGGLRRGHADRNTMDRLIYVRSGACCGATARGAPAGLLPPVHVPW